MPNENDQSNPKDPKSGSGTGAGSGAGSGSSPNSDAPKAAGSKGGATPDDNDKPIQPNIVAAAAVGGLVGGLVGALIGSSLRP